MARSTITILIVDDHDLVRAGISRLLLDVPGLKVVGEANCGEDAIKLVRDLSPKVVLMDLIMPGIGGLEATKKIVRYNPDVKVLVVTACNDNIHPPKLLQAGAAGYLTKDSSIDELIRAIKSVNVGQRYISSNIAQQIVLRTIDGGDRSLFDTLSERELQVATMVSKGYKAQDIAEKLNLSSKTVNSYRYRIFNKLRVNGDVELARLAIQNGLVET